VQRGRHRRTGAAQDTDRAYTGFEPAVAATAGRALQRLIDDSFVRALAATCLLAVVPVAFVFIDRWFINRRGPEPEVESVAPH
jgi:hypothetical protein